MTKCRAALRIFETNSPALQCPSQFLQAQAWPELLNPELRRHASRFFVTHTHTHTHMLGILQRSHYSCSRWGVPGAPVMVIQTLSLAWIDGTATMLGYPCTCSDRWRRYALARGAMDIGAVMRRGTTFEAPFAETRKCESSGFGGSPSDCGTYRRNCAPPDTCMVIFTAAVSSHIEFLI